MSHTIQPAIRRRRVEEKASNMRESELLCGAWLATSLDPGHGKEQKGTTFWRNIHIWFHQHKHFAPYSYTLICNREWKSLNHRWYTIQEASPSIVGT